MKRRVAIANAMLFAAVLVQWVLGMAFQTAGCSPRSPARGGLSLYENHHAAASGRIGHEEST